MREFLRVKQRQFLLGSTDDNDYVYIPVSSIERVEQHSGDVTIYWHTNVSSPSVKETCIEDTSFDDVFSSENIFTVGQ
jgi:hypothetical protein